MAEKEIHRPIKFQDVDIIAFQGLVYEKKTRDVEPKDDMKGLISELKNYQFVYTPYMTQLYKLSEEYSGLHHSEGLGIFSRFPIIESDYIRFVILFDVDN